jgi:hypothetical protein
MTSKRSNQASESRAGQPTGGGMPGDGAGRREEPGRTGVHPASAGWPEGSMELIREGEWGQGERGLAGQDDHGESELWLPGDAPPAEGRRDIVEQPDLDEGADRS